MIFLTVGSQKFQFDRLIKAVDLIAPEIPNNEKVFAQIGNSTYIPINMEYANFLNKDEFEKKILNCDLLITHSAAGVMVSGLKNNKKIIAVPRLCKFSEHVDDNQTELGTAFSKENYLLYVEDLNLILPSIEQIKHITFEKYKSSPQTIVDIITNYMGNTPPNCANKLST